MDGSIVRFNADAFRGTFEGKLTADGASVAGTWTRAQGGAEPLEFMRATKENAWPLPPGHSVQLIAVDKDVTLEVLDWGGSGRPLVLLSGLGNTAHTFDGFAPKLTASYHVYGITRRGFGNSSAPATGYSADRLGDDVLRVLDSLGLKRPVLVGHSIGGQELSSIGSRYPERVAGLIYLDAGYAYAYYDTSRGDLWIDSMDLYKKLEQLQPGKEGPKDAKQFARELIETSLPRFERILREWIQRMEAAPAPPATTQPQPPAQPTISDAIFAGMQKYTDIRVPVLAIYAAPHMMPTAAEEVLDAARMEAITNAFEKGIPSARVVRVPRADHFIFRSNEAEVLLEINAFISGLP